MKKELTPTTTKVCKQCGNEYNKKDLIRQLGKNSPVVDYGFCSAKCYTIWITKPSPTTKGELLQDEPRFNYQDLDEEINIPDLKNWVDKRELDGLVDETKGGIIAYIHYEHIDEVCGMLNERQKLLDSNRELIEKLTMAKSAYFHLKMALNPKWDYRKDVYYQEFLETISNAKNIQP